MAIKQRVSNEFIIVLRKLFENVHRDIQAHTHTHILWELILWFVNRQKDESNISYYT